MATGLVQVARGSREDPAEGDTGHLGASDSTLASCASGNLCCCSPSPQGIPPWMLKERGREGVTETSMGCLPPRRAGGGTCTHTLGTCPDRQSAGNLVNG